MEIKRQYGEVLDLSEKEVEVRDLIIAFENGEAAADDVMQAMRIDWHAYQAEKKAKLIKEQELNSTMRSARKSEYQVDLY